MNGRRPRPIIGLTTYRQVVAWGPWEREAAFVPATYVDVVAAAGGQPVLLPPVGCLTPERADSRGARDGREAEDVTGALDGLVLVGGGDVGPHHYGAERHAETAGPARAATASSSPSFVGPSPTAFPCSPCVEGSRS